MDSPNSPNETSLDIAFRNGRLVRRIKVLEYGADPTMGNISADRRMHEIDFVRLLCIAGSHANSQGTVLDIEIDDYYKFYEIAPMLLENGVDPNKEEIFFFVFCVVRSLPVAVESFLKSNSVASLGCNDWNTCLIFATKNLGRERNAWQCCTLLISHGNLENEDWCEPNCLDFNLQPDLCLFWEVCKADLLLMKKHDLGNGVSMSFYVRKKAADQLAALIRRSCFAKCPNEFSHEINKLYNVYNGVLIAKIREGVVRHHWLNLFETVIRHSDLNRLSSELVWKLSKYLCNDDIKKVVMHIRNCFFK